MDEQVSKRAKVGTSAAVLVDLTEETSDVEVVDSDDLESSPMKDQGVATQDAATSSSRTEHLKSPERSQASSSTVEDNVSSSRDSLNTSLKFLVLDLCIVFNEDKKSPPLFVLLGKDAAGRRARVTVEGFANYFYADAERFTKEELLAEEGAIRVDDVERAPIFYYRKSGAKRRMFKVTYVFGDKKKKPIDSEGRFETDIKLKRRFQTEYKIGAGCTVLCKSGIVKSESADSIEVTCHHQADRKSVV